MRELTAVPVPRFRSSPHLTARSRANFGIERALADHSFSVALNLKLLRGLGRHSGRSFKFATLLAIWYCVGIASAAEGPDCAVAAPLVSADYPTPRVAAAVQRERRSPWRW